MGWRIWNGRERSIRQGAMHINECILIGFLSGFMILSFEKVTAGTAYFVGRYE